MKIILFALLSLLSLIALVTGDVCPEEVISPCICSGERDIECGGDTLYNIKAVFEKLSAHIGPNGDKHYSVFHLSNRVIEELEDDLFADITFTRILIRNAEKLRIIRVNAFRSSFNTLERFEQLHGSSIGFNANEYELFHGLSLLTNLQWLSFEYHRIASIPSYAFDYGHQKHLKNLNFHARSTLFRPKFIQTLGNYAFQRLTNLTNLNLYNQNISYIPKNAFDFEEPLDEVLQIQLGDNPLDGSSFEVGVFMGAKRPIWLRMHNKGPRYENSLYLDEKVFSPFLRADKRNRISISADNPWLFYLCDCRSYWLVRDKEIIRDQIENDFLCSGNTEFAADSEMRGKSIWDLGADFFSKC